VDLLPGSSSVEGSRRLVVYPARGTPDRHCALEWVADRGEYQSHLSHHSPSPEEMQSDDEGEDSSLTRHPTRGEPRVSDGTMPRVSLEEVPSQPTSGALFPSEVDVGPPGGKSAGIELDTETLSIDTAKVESNSPSGHTRVEQVSSSSGDERRPGTSAKHSKTRSVEHVDRPSHHKAGRGRLMPTRKASG
jgi:hypothetical protein